MNSVKLLFFILFDVTVTTTAECCADWISRPFGIDIGVKQGWLSPLLYYFCFNNDLEDNGVIRGTTKLKTLEKADDLVIPS